MTAEESLLRRAWPTWQLLAEELDVAGVACFVLVLRVSSWSTPMPEPGR